MHVCRSGSTSRRCLRNRSPSTTVSLETTPFIQRGTALFALRCELISYFLNTRLQPHTDSLLPVRTSRLSNMASRRSPLDLEVFKSTKLVIYIQTAV